jgi:predicted oxidoreductase
MAHSSAEVAIIGGGIAGIAAALGLLDLGRDVLLLDRDVEGNFGGLAKESFGGLFFVNSREQQRNGIKDSQTLALQDWHSFAEFGPDDRYPKLWAETYVERCIPDIYEWLRAGGIRFLPLPAWVERGEARPGNSVPRFHIVWGTGFELATRLIAALRTHPNRRRLRLEFGRRVERLLTEAGRIVGCAGAQEQDGTPFEIRADHVVIASGGINGSIDRVKANWHRDWGRPPEIILNGSHRYADGTLHDAAVR